jgi:phosphatidylserine/phosphatidylglycerophosphate/cardiolipin synthase-like enzyme
VVRESPETLDRFESALTDGRIGPSSTLAGIQDALGIDNPRAQRYRGVVRAAGSRSIPDLIDAVRLAREAMSCATARAPSVEVAWTWPGAVQPPVRPTGAVAREIIDGARRTVLVVGYSVTVDHNLTGLAARTVAAMAEAARRGVMVTAVLHREPNNRAALLRGWPQGREAPRMFTWPEQTDDAMASLHAKVLVADAHDALVTSANLTYHGLEANVEVGVRITGDAPRRLESVFHELIRLREFVPWPQEERS